jgi:hypothetical protein
MQRMDMAVEHELFREVLGTDSQRLRGSTSRNRMAAVALARDVILFGADVRTDIREE